MTSSDSGETPDPSTNGSSADGPYGPPPINNPYGQAPATPPPYGQPQTPPPFGQPPPLPAGQAGYPAPAYGTAPQPGYGAPVLANHPSATTAMVLSIIGLAGIAFCGGITLVLSPFAWRMGAKAVKEIDASPGAYGGRDQANAARIMGIIGTALLALGFVLLLGLFALVAVGATSSTSP